MEYQQFKKRVKREKPNKKWTEDDIKLILNYLQEAPEVEAPTAQIFYKKLIDRSGIDATWDLVRWKVRHLKALFKKANDWRQSTGAGLLDSDAGTSSVEGKVLQMCPHYKQLKEIFGEKNVQGGFVVFDSGDLTTMEDSITIEETEPTLETSFLGNTVYDVEELTSVLPPHQFTEIQATEKQSTQPPAKLTQSSSSSIPKKGKDFAEKLKKHAPKSSAAHLATFQTERTELFKIKLDWEKERYKKEHELSERKLKLEEEKVKQDVEFKKLELEKEERLKMIELEMNERIKKFEIEIKYKSQSQI